MTQNISDFQNVVREIDRLSLDEQLELIAYIAGKIQQYKSTSDKKSSFKNIIGTEKSGFATPEEADKVISQERDFQPEKAFTSLIINLFSQKTNLDGIDKSAFIHQTAKLGKKVSLGKNVVVSANITHYNKLHIEGIDQTKICRVTCIDGGCFKS